MLSKGSRLKSDCQSIGFSDPGFLEKGVTAATYDALTAKLPGFLKPQFHLNFITGAGTIGQHQEPVRSNRQPLSLVVAQPVNISIGKKEKAGRLNRTAFEPFDHTRWRLVSHG